MPGWVGKTGGLVLMELNASDSGEAGWSDVMQDRRGGMAEGIRSDRPLSYVRDFGEPWQPWMRFRNGSDAWPGMLSFPFFLFILFLSFLFFFFFYFLRDHFGQFVEIELEEAKCGGLVLPPEQRL